VSAFALEKIARVMPDALLERPVDRTGGHWGLVRPEALPAVAQLVKSDPELDFKLFLSIDAVDRLHLTDNTPRFEVFYFAFSVSRGEHLRLKVRVSEEWPEVPSLVSVYQGANWWERFVWDFYGIRFLGHPDLTRILMYEEFKGHPLRKDYPLRGRQPLIPERPVEDIFRGPGTSGVV
jgi:NADH-quinone oxidoreductase subunit C